MVIEDEAVTSAIMVEQDFKDKKTTCKGVCTELLLQDCLRRIKPIIFKNRSDHSGQALTFIGMGFGVFTLLRLYNSINMVRTTFKSQFLYLTYRFRL